LSCLGSAAAVWLTGDCHHVHFWLSKVEAWQHHWGLTQVF
jgi:hypothetical protein